MTDSLVKTMLHERYDWLDQARGFVVLLLIISMPTSEYAGDLLTGDPVLGPPMLNHGYEYFDGDPAITTFIDSGQALFLMIMGFVGYTAFTSRLRKRGVNAAFWYCARRVGVLYALASIDCVLLELATSGKPKWADFFYNGTFAMIALGTLCAFLSIVVIPNADRRMLFSVGLIMLHSLLYAFPLFDHHTWYDNILALPKFPFGTLGMCAMAIAGSSFGQWHAMDPGDPCAGFRKRIVPVSTAAFVAAYCMDWVQPAQHHDSNAAMLLQAMYIGGFMLMIFFAFGEVGFRFPLLSSLGRNLLLMFALGGLFIGIYLDCFPKEFLLQSPYLALLLGGLAPIVMLSCIAVFLDRRGIMVRA